MLSPYGRDVWLPILIAGAVIFAGFALLGWWIPAAVIALITLALLSFFRDPRRRIPEGLQPGDMLSPADGVVSAVLELDHHEAVGGPARLVRIFLSILNVHVNRAPCDAEVVSVTHRAGKFLNAQTEESALVNESKLLVLRIGAGKGDGDGDGDGKRDGAGDEAGETIGLRLVSGMIARTIVCPLQVGDRMQRGEKIGMIKFGSTAELILPRPHDATVHVRKGDSVRGGLTVLATLKPRGITTE